MKTWNPCEPTGSKNIWKTSESLQNSLSAIILIVIVTSRPMEYTADHIFVLFIYVKVFWPRLILYLTMSGSSMRFRLPFSLFLLLSFSFSSKLSPLWSPLAQQFSATFSTAVLPRFFESFLFHADPFSIFHSGSTFPNIYSSNSNSLPGSTHLFWSW